MPLKKIGEVNDLYAQCDHPEHNPPKGTALEPGCYEYTCPSCGRRIEFTVPYHGYISMSSPLLIAPRWYRRQV